ncbi:MAG: DUF4870 domain-containing protein [Clostridiales bacterium]|nr:DUF4870 domain-containing protein [Clostridiales bacterium]
MNEQFQNQPYPPAPKQQNTVMGVLSYISILCLIPLLTEKNDPFVQYHAKQGLNLFIIEVVVGIIGGVLTGIFNFIPFVGGILSGVIGFVTGVLSLCFFVLSILGIVNVCNGEMKPLPVIEKIQLIK